MQGRTISMNVGKGSVNHNTRAFHADNTDPERSHLNRTYIHTNIKEVYHQLFDEALERFNAKQTRQDRCIPNYYEKIASSKQEKPFHELIVQVGNHEDCGVTSTNGERATHILNQYMGHFQERNPNLHIFSAHLHMDEATPHLHIDFVPFTTGSKRGLDTRVSLKQALAAQGFKGGTRGDTEWNQWVHSEKEVLAEVMQEHGIQWEPTMSIKLSSILRSKSAVVRWRSSPQKWSKSKPRSRPSKPRNPKSKMWKPLRANHPYLIKTR